jgi:serine kinase of HPr protein (carbohydrate metabolism regulator)
MYILARKGGAIVHAAGASICGQGMLFAGPSSAGKTTLSGLLAGQEHIELLSDDRMVVRRMGDQYLAFGTPWPGEAGVAVNQGVPLSALFFIYHGTDNRIREIPAQVALERLLPVASIPWFDRDVLPTALSFCDDLLSHIRAYELHFERSSTVADTLREFVAA